ncbi:hypothetical protein CDD80_2171 [Ophiocordyceps camponoti-rufipedis]|uniref:Mitochondrial import inner membrane translocase subunit TIM50 n=1 Tax=Ophiocordyceps camponoti-rufipedis TaxID=2004952 RepID=A0A2C5Z8I5_9HYPO|nr:hypothetical protein CDD80_2171 [Ophiocordyceps camponoti-rufipedis]
MLSRVARAPRLVAVGHPSLGRLSLCRFYSRKNASPHPRSPPPSGKTPNQARQNQPPARDGDVDLPAGTRSVPLGAGKTPEQQQQPSLFKIPAAADAQTGQTPPQESTPEGEARESEIHSPYASGTTPLHKLPDLTRGIPSTLDQEMHEQAGRPSAALQTIDAQVGGRRTREKYIPSSERNRSWWIRFVLLATAVGSAAAIIHMGRNWDDNKEADRHPEAPNGWGINLWWQRMRVRMGESVSYYHDPAFEKLLPDMDPTFERPYTLVLSLDDLLIHSEWSREHGWRIAKRPGMDYFVRYLSQYYELVLFTSVPFTFAEPLVRKLDPFRFIMWPLFREATKFEGGEIVKDLSFLNRDLSKVIIIDTNAAYVRKQPENAILLDPWKGDVKDKELVSLIPFLEYIYTMQHSDVRKVLKSFEGKHIPTEFARREAIARQEFHKQLEARKAK